jgi:Asp-tRNA(Asn)/Glu-tRNA(Gln) amidotransferase A subunit family amidase
MHLPGPIRHLFNCLPLCWPHLAPCLRAGVFSATRFVRPYDRVVTCIPRPSGPRLRPMKFTCSYNRREFIFSAARTSAAALVFGNVKWSFAEPESSELAELSAVEATIAIVRGDIKAEEYAQALIRRCDAGRYLNVFISAMDRDKDLEAARAADKIRASASARGLLHGVPVVATDSINSAALPTTAGTRELRNFRPIADAPVLARVLREGAILLGKTNLHELSLGWTSNNQVFGAVHNPYRSDRVSGGSNGGTAAAVAARMVPAGLGEDTDGSIRIPAALCGIAGLRPSVGRYPAGGILPLSPTLGTAGTMARSVADLALLDVVLTGGHGFLQPVPLKGVRLGVSRAYYFSDLDAAVAQVTEQALAKLKDAGATLIEAEIPRLAELAPGIIVSVLYYELRRNMSAYLAAQGAPVTFAHLVHTVSPDIRRLLGEYAFEDHPGAASESAYANALQNLRPALQAAYRQYFDQHHLAAVIFPTVRMAAPSIAAEAISPAPDVQVNGKLLASRVAFARNAAPSSVAGFPGLVIPAGLTRDGVPVGLELDGRVNGDRELLALGLAVEKVLGRIPAPRI